MASRAAPNTKRTTKRSPTTEPAAPRSVGRPSSYRPEYAEQARKLCLLGATDADLADFFGVVEQTVNNWKTDHPEFLESLKAGKEQSDSQVVKRLYERATGYSHPAVKIFANGGEITEAPYTEHYPPDTTAAIFWLKNRQPELWRDRQQVEHSGTLTLEAILAESNKGAT